MAALFTIDLVPAPPGLFRRHQFAICGHRSNERIGGSLNNAVSPGSDWRYNHNQGDVAMTALLQQAFTVAAKLPELEQEALAVRLLSELVEENGFDRSVAGTSSEPVGLAREAISEKIAGQTEAFEPRHGSFRPPVSLNRALAEIEAIQTGMRLTPSDGSDELLRQARAGGLYDRKPSE
jgi:hypothetical protein